MKNRLFLIGLVILLILPASLWAADIAGKWTAQAPSQQGNVELTLTFKVDGEKLTGTLENPDVGPADMKDGKIDGKNVSFHVVRDFNGMEMKIIWKGKITGDDEITFKRTVEMGGGGGFGGGGGQGGQGGQGAETEIIAKRAK